MQKLLKNILSACKGKKTYVISGLMVILGLLQGNNDMILQGLGFAALRNAGEITSKE